MPATPTPAPERRAAAAGRCTPRRSRGTLKDGRRRPQHLAERRATGASQTVTRRKCALWAPVDKLGSMITKPLPFRAQTINEEAICRPVRHPLASQAIRQKLAKKVVQMVVY